ncbi:hypothetical protein A2647_01700 [Candidatus Nomurabacteria bacterium RIFCSPHIGHO2_01_FULL_40_24b]|uniref:Uncharacterized protein n=1 Tax=Candidatus Nomurabacteria bacterium RIFCSPHIGHO2_01_FULL_40_24b TaxID=1801739 RepID=A0A1F6V7W7_9BACT|nr:MAG: hypothetical protein A2647_01700 [Candidatus Nomurabacteria bacterium RIFCSPHIGHO2_01_FULL_40_24b]
MSTETPNPPAIFRIEEETGFKPNQLVVHKIARTRGRVQGYFKEGDKKFLVVKIPDILQHTTDTIDKWEGVSD